MAHDSRRVVVLLLAILISAVVSAQTSQKPLVNDDVVQMVKSGLPESTIIAAIKANPSNFDISPSALIALHESSVGQKIMEAMLGVAGRNAPKKPGSSSAPGSSRPSSLAGATVSQITVALIQNATRQNVPIERTRLAQTTTKPKSMASLAKDRVLDQTFRAGVSSAIGRTGSSALGPVVGGAAGILIGGIFSGSGKPKDVTYVWAIQGAESETALASESAVFELSLGEMRSVRPDDYAPAIVQLTPTANGWRLVGATEGKENAGSRVMTDWPVYSDFVEERIPAQVEKSAPGNWKVSLTAPLSPGEYALVLRPVSKSKRFAGQDVARNQGDGLLFNSAWSFAVK